MLILVDDGITTLTGEVADQPALHGLLTRIRDLGLPLLSVNRSLSEQDAGERVFQQGILESDLRRKLKR